MFGQIEGCEGVQLRAVRGLIQVDFPLKGRQAGILKGFPLRNLGIGFQDGNNCDNSNLATTQVHISL